MCLVASSAKGNTFVAKLDDVETWKKLNVNILRELVYCLILFIDEAKIKSQQNSISYLPLPKNLNPYRSRVRNESLMDSV